MSTQLTPEEEQEKLLEEAKKVINGQAFYMKRCLDNAKIMDALKHASNMISELRTSMLTPKTYYSLYMTVFDHLRHLESYLLEEKHGKRMAELYELVQYAGNILPRLYLLTTVRSVYIKLQEAPAKDVLRDLVEMCRGVQHPTRGLFLRNYLSEMTKDKLPDLDQQQEGKGEVADSVEFILSNFTEMNKLWVRMQHQGPVRDKERRETERLELRILVGKNLSRISQLEGVDVKMYTTSVLPRVLEQIINCKDRIAQQYLMEIMIQVFPDEFHLATLEQILTACGQLQTGVDVKVIIASLIDRLAQFATKTSPDSMTAGINIFDTFFTYIGKVVEQRANMEVPDVLSLQVSLLNLSLKCYPTELSYVDQVLGFCASYLEGLQTKQSTDYTKPAAVKQIVYLLTYPIESYKNVLTVLKLENYPKLTAYLSYSNRKKVATDLIKNAVENETVISEPEQVEKLLQGIQTLIKDEADMPEMDELDKEDFEEEQRLVASLVHMFNSADVGKLYKIYQTARKHFVLGGDQRIKHTLVPLVFRSLRLISKIREQRASGELEFEEEDWKKIGDRIFTFTHETISILKKNNPDLALKLFLQAAHAADLCSFETVSYEFIEQVFTIYQEEIADSKAQVNAILLIIGTLFSFVNISEDNFQTLVGQTAQWCNRLLKKSDKSQAITTVAHLFWKKNSKDGGHVLECMQKALKVASEIMDSTTKTALFVSILNEYLYYFGNEGSEIPANHISRLIQLVNTEKNTDNTAPENTATNTFYQNTLNYIQQKKQAGSDGYEEITV